MKYIYQITAAVLGMSVLLSGCGKKVQGMPEMQQSATTVEVSTAEKELIEDKYMFSGTIKAKDEVNVLSSLNNTKVKKVNFKVGDKVDKGDVLFTLDTTDIQNSIQVLQASLAAADANIKSAQTNLELANGASMQTQVENAKNAITNAENVLQGAKLTLNTAKTDFDNNQVLFEAGAISQNELDNYQNIYENAQLSYDKCVEALNQANTNYDILVNQTMQENERKAQDSLNSAKASRQATAAQMASYQKSLNDANVTSPISGTVQECNVTEGAMLSSTTPFVIVDLDTVKVEVSVSEQMISYVHEGDEVEIKAESYSDDVFYGNVTTVSPGASSDGTYPVTIEIDNTDGSLKSGMFAEVYFIKEKSTDSIVLDRSAVLTKNDESYVFVDVDDVAKKTAVTTGIDTGDKIQIITGLEEGDIIVTNGNSYLKDGDAIHVVSKVDTQQENTEKGETADTKESVPVQNKPEAEEE